MAKFSLKKRLRSFVFAWDGFVFFIKSQHNAWIHCFATILVLICGLTVGLSLIEWAVLTLCIGFVFVAEIINTAIEELVNYVSPEHSLAAKRIKDLAAAAVLFAAIIAVVAGILILGSKILNFISLVQNLHH